MRTRTQKAAISKLASFIEKEEYDFDMEEAIVNPKCGSAGCIGGHAAMLWKGIRATRGGHYFTWDDEKLANKLGLSFKEHELLCFTPLDSENNHIYLGDIDRTMAVATLRRLATGDGEIFFEKV